MEGGREGWRKRAGSALLTEMESEMERERAHTHTRKIQLLLLLILLLLLLLLLLTAHTLFAQLNLDKQLRAANQGANRNRIARNPELQKVTLTDEEMQARIERAKQNPLDILGNKSLDDWFIECSDHLKTVPPSGKCVLAEEMILVYIFNTMQHVQKKEVSHPRHSACECVAGAGIVTS